MPSNPKIPIDIAIVGGSTAGLATAIYGTLAGFSCVVFEPRDFPDKPCGEGFLPSAVTLLNEMGIDLTGSYPVSGIRYLNGKNVAERVFPDGHGIGMRRTDLQRSMLKRAEQLGVRIIKTKVSSYEDQGSSVAVEDFSARWLVGCDGLRSTICKQMGGPKVRKRVARFGLRRHFLVDKAPTFVEVYWGSDFEIYLTPVAENMVNVAVLFTKSRSFEEFIAQFPGLAAMLAKPVSKLLGAGPFEKSPSLLHSGNVFLVGDAAGFLDPLTGDGNQLAIAAARELIDCIARKREEEYPVRWHKLVRGYWQLTDTLLKIASSRLTRHLLVPTLKRFPYLFNLAFFCLSYRSLSPLVHKSTSNRL